jgi:phage terminase large subunit-like protein
MTTQTSTRADPGQRAVNFFAKRLHLTEDYHGVRFVPFGWQEQFLRDVFGTLKPDGLRQYQTAYIEIPKKNAKTTTCAGVCLKGLYDETPHGAHVYSAGPTREQAGYIYRIAASMIRQCDRLARVDGKPVKLYDRDKRIYLPTRESFYQALSSDAGYSDGINPSIAVIDEVHRHKNGELIAVIKEGMGMRRDPLVVMITTAGESRAGFAWQWHEYASQVLAGIRDDPTFYAVLFGADDDADAWAEQTWLDCNPALAAGLLSIDDFRRAAREAQGIASAELDFRRLRLNQWISNSQKWINRVHWDSCGGWLEPKPEELEGRECYGGIDLGETDDFSAFVLLFPWLPEEPHYEKYGPGFHVVPHLYMPEEGLVRKRDSDIAGDLKRWAAEGYLTIMPGPVEDHDIIIADVLAAAEAYDLREVGYDPWRMKQLRNRLEGEGVPMVVVKQSQSQISEPCKFLEVLLAKQRINHWGHPVMRWMADNAIVRRDASGNIRPDKNAAKQKIDGIVAMVMALERAMHQETPAEVQFIALD